jgi:hypothetical protein
VSLIVHSLDFGKSAFFFLGFLFTTNIISLASFFLGLGIFFLLQESSVFLGALLQLVFLSLFSTGKLASFRFHFGFFVSHIAGLFVRNLATRHALLLKRGHVIKHIVFFQQRPVLDICLPLRLGCLGLFFHFLLVPFFILGILCLVLLFNDGQFFDTNGTHQVIQLFGSLPRLAFSFFAFLVDLFLVLLLESYSINLCHLFFRNGFGLFAHLQ